MHGTHITIMWPSHFLSSKVLLDSAEHHLSMCVRYNYSMYRVAGRVDVGGGEERE